MLTALTELAVNTTDPTQLQRVWQVAERYILPECEYLPDADGSVGRSVGALLLTLELVVQTVASDSDAEVDPFRISSVSASGMPVQHRDVLVEMLCSEAWKAGMREATKEIVSLLLCAAMLH